MHEYDSGVQRLGHCRKPYKQKEEEQIEPLENVKNQLRKLEPSEHPWWEEEP